MIGISGESLTLAYLVLIFLIIVCFFWLAISIIKKYTVGKIVSVVLILLLSYPFFEKYYRDYVFNNDLKKDLKTLNFKLNDDFKIPLRYGSHDFQGRSQTTQIEISYNDKLKLIDQIIQSKNYLELKNENEILLNHDNSNLLKYYLNCKYPEYYSRKLKSKIENKHIEIELKIYIMGNIIELDIWEK